MRLDVLLGERVERRNGNVRGALNDRLGTAVERIDARRDQFPVLACQLAGEREGDAVERSDSMSRSFAPGSL